MRAIQKLSNRNKVIILTATALFAAVLGTWLLLAPHREREYVATAQEAMLEDLMRDIYADEQGLADTEGIADLLEYAEADGDLYFWDYYGNENDVSAFTRVPIFADPIPDNAFPAAITGIGILTIESIDLRLSIADDIEYATLRIAPGRVPQTAQIGDIGNAVVAGHRNYAFGSMFNRFGEIEIGDIVQYQARNGEMMEFVVFEVAVIEPENQIAFLQPTNESIITLYTCTPIREATHRLIIRAERIS